MQLSDKALISLTDRGLIAAPKESEDEFLKRIASVSKKRGSACTVYSMQPDWIEVLYSNRNLRIWEGGATWVEGDHITIQLRKRLEQKKRIFSLYDSQELLEHESVHAIRHRFEEPKFEEILAYQTSKIGYRRFWGPIFSSPKESLFFVVLLCLFVFSFYFSWLQLIFGGILVAYIAGMTWRICRRQFLFKKTKKKLCALFKTKAEKTILFLTDQEIVGFAKMSEVQIRQYLQKEQSTQLRIRQLLLSVDLSLAGISNI